MSEASVDIRTGHVVSKQPVELKLLQGTLDAKRLEIVEFRRSRPLRRRRKMILMLNQPAKDEPDNAPPAAPGAPKP